MLEAALNAGKFTSKGGTVLSAGIIPTPGVAFLTRELYADGGVVISTFTTILLNTTVSNSSTGKDLNSLMK